MLTYLMYYRFLWVLRQAFVNKCLTTCARCGNLSGRQTYPGALQFEQAPDCSAAADNPDHFDCQNFPMFDLT